MSNMTSAETKLVSFVTSHVDKWREHRNTNYEKLWDEYERLWLGNWSSEDRNRESERSRVVTPATLQAVESFQSEVEEATFGKGSFFDISDDVEDQDKQDIELLRRKLREDCDCNGYKAAISETILNLAVFGTGVLELIPKREKRKRPATRPLGDGRKLIGTEEKPYFSVKPHPVHPRNFVIDPAATTIEEAMGCAVEEFVPAYSVVQDMESGVYDKRELGLSPTDQRLETTREETNNDADRVKLIRYYGLVPAALLKEKTEEITELFPQEEGIDLLEFYKDMVEAVVVIANDGILLKAEENNYMMGDRPIVAAPCDVRPGRFWGRGIVEKGYNMQKTMDAQVRSHLDSIALTAVPMMGVDATRMPRGFKFEVKPGRSILTNGNPAESLMPLKFGESSTINVDTANLFERYLLQATGTVDSSAQPQVAANGADPEAMGAALSGIIKRHRRTMTQFQERFILPLIKKTAFRYMQFDPDRYPVDDFKFVPSGTLGIIAREYEQRQYMSMMSTLGPDSKLVPILMLGILENSSLSNRDELIAQIQQSMQPDPMQQQLQQLEMQKMQLEVAKLDAEVKKLTAEAGYTEVKAELEPRKIDTAMIAALTKNSEEADEFGQRVKIAEIALKEADITEKVRDRESNERITAMQVKGQLEAAKLSATKKSEKSS